MSVHGLSVGAADAGHHDDRREGRLDRLDRRATAAEGGQRWRRCPSSVLVASLPAYFLRKSLRNAARTRLSIKTPLFFVTSQL